MAIFRQLCRISVVNGGRAAEVMMTVDKSPGLSPSPQVSAINLVFFSTQSIIQGERSGKGEPIEDGLHINPSRVKQIDNVMIITAQSNSRQTYPMQAGFLPASKCTS